MLNDKDISKVNGHLKMTDLIVLVNWEDDEYSQKIT